MRSNIAFPFLRIPDELVSCEGWMLGEPGTPLVPADDILEGWDYGRALEATCTLEFNPAMVAAALQVDRRRLVLDASLCLGTGTGRIPKRSRLVHRISVAPGSGRIELAGTIEGSQLSGRLKLTAQLALGEPAAPQSSVSPKVVGARLWETHQDILIEDGGDARFPVESMSFSAALAGKPYVRAPWYLHWQPDLLEADFAASVRLYINRDCEEVAARFAKGDPGTLQAILADVMSQMITRVVEDDPALEALPECEEGSVGYQVQRWMELAFPAQEPLQIRSKARQMPGAFRAEILAAAEVGAMA